MFRFRQRLLVAAILLAASATAGGHSSGESTTPRDGATLESPPDRIRIRFDEPIRVTRLDLTRDDGRTFEATFDRGEETERLTARPESLPSGSYTVEWRGLSADGHSASGSFRFQVE